MDKKIKERWIKSLLSKRYKQNDRFLRVRNKEGKLEYSALGVLANLIKVNWKRAPQKGRENYCLKGVEHVKIPSQNIDVHVKVFHEFDLPTWLIEKIGMKSKEHQTLKDLMSQYNLDFVEIAKWVEEKL